jgi:hypothetical protein
VNNFYEKAIYKPENNFWRGRKPWRNDPSSLAQEC